MVCMCKHAAAPLAQQNSAKYCFTSNFSSRLSYTCIVYTRAYISECQTLLVFSNITINYAVNTSCFSNFLA